MSNHPQRKKQKMMNNPVTGVQEPPTDKELIQEYLKKKLANLPLPHNIFNEVNIYDHNPYDLAEQYKPWEVNNRWHFFTERRRMATNNSRPDRSAGNGVWRLYGCEQKIYSNEELIGSKRALQFYLGGRRNEWFMEEYSLPETGDVSEKPEDDTKLDDCVMCVIRRKTEPRRRRRRRRRQPE